MYLLLASVSPRLSAGLCPFSSIPLIDGLMCTILARDNRQYSL